MHIRVIQTSNYHIASATQLHKFSAENKIVKRLFLLLPYIWLNWQNKNIEYIVVYINRCPVHYIVGDILPYIIVLSVVYNIIKNTSTLNIFEN